ncbi:MAG: hypothetical protein HZA83_02175 [Thaumarchaeota archaeon]|nr:hypothetical protein [Nitrososphaerota archaeon]
MLLSLEERLGAYQLCNNLIKENLERKIIVEQISNKFGIAPSTVYEWLRGKSPYGNRAGRIRFARELFYVLGSLLGDGYIYYYRKRYRVGLSVRDKSFAMKFADKLSKVVARKVKYYHYSKRDLWFVQVYNAELFFLFNQLRTNLPELNLLMRQGNYRLNALEFVEGFFDAEGSVKIIKEKVRRTPKVAIDATNKRLDYLILMGNLVEEVLGIKTHFSSQFDKRRNSTYHHLRIYKKSDVNKFLAKIHTIKNRKSVLLRRLLA